MSRASHKPGSADESNDSFKRIALTPAERLWLTEVHKQGFGAIDTRSMRIMLRDKLPKGFSPKSLRDKNLIYGEHISLLGIWHVDPRSEYIEVADRIIRCLRDILIEGKTESVTAHDISVREHIDERVVEIALALIGELGGFFGQASGKSGSFGYTTVFFSRDDEYTDKLIHFESIEQELEQLHRRAEVRSSPSARPRMKARGRGLPQAHALTGPLGLPETDISSQSACDGSSSNKQLWDAIHSEFGFGKQLFGKRIAFVTDKRERDILFRDVEHAYLLCKNGLCKPAIILAGSVIEELLRLYLDTKGIKPPTEKFEAYIKKCEEMDQRSAVCPILFDTSGTWFTFRKKQPKAT